MDSEGRFNFNLDLQSVKNNDPYMKKLGGSGGYDFIDVITNEQWEEIGRDISNNTHLENLTLDDGALRGEKASFLFRGLTKSSSLRELWFGTNGLRVAGVRSMVPFLQNANSLQKLDLDGNDIQSEGFNILIRALRDSPIEELTCRRCGIESIEIDADYFPKKLKTLGLSGQGNNSGYKINADGCRGLATLLQGGDSTLEHLFLSDNNVDDEGVAILVEALRNNTSLKCLGLSTNDRISKEGLVMLLKLVNDVSSIQATLQSNHTLRALYVSDIHSDVSLGKKIQSQIAVALQINGNSSNPEAAGREKVRQTQLNSTTRAELAELQGAGVNHSVYSEINPLHLPEVLSLVGRRHGQDELYAALKSSVAGVISIVNRRRCIMQQLAYHEARLAQELAYYSANVNGLRTELAEIDAGEGDASHVGNKGCNKRRRKR